MEPEHSEDSLRLLVHNVSHTDLCITIQPSSVMYISQDRELMARPRASRYKHVCDEITSAIEKGAKYKGVTYRDECNKEKYVGFVFDPPSRICSWSDFRLRDPNTTRTTSESLSCSVVRVFFPLISVIIPKWMALLSNNTEPIVPRYHLGALPNNELAENMETDHSALTQIKPNLNDLSTKCSEVSSDNDSSTCSKKEAIHHIDHKHDSPEIEYYSSDHYEEKCGEIQTMAKKHSIGSVGSNSTYKDFESNTHTIYKLFIVSGAGHPQKKQSAYYQEDSTQKLAHLLCRFIADFYPQISVKQFYSDDIFHYVENIKFVHSQLRPAIDKERKRLATIHGKHWKKFFNLSVTLCDGTPARLSCIIEGLRSFEPDMLHMFRRKSLWTNYPNVDKLWDSDFEYLKFNQMETYPAIPLHDIYDDNVINMVNEMRKWKRVFTQTAIINEQSEMSRFWLRKTHQPVLAILSVQKPNEKQPTYYRGLNVEVSMPTGSLCAERNAVGTALAADPSLRREHFQYIAVLFMGELEKENEPMTPLFTAIGRRSPAHIEPEDVNPRGPCGSCQEWLKKIAECNPSFKVITFASRELEEVIIRNLK